MSRDFEEALSFPDECPEDNEANNSESIFSEKGSVGLDSFDLKQEIADQINLLKSIRGYLFHPNGNPKTDTEASDITSYMNASLKLLSMLQSIESDLKTDEDVRHIEAAIDMALEDCPCPEFVENLVQYLEDKTL